ncbi:MAG: nucleoside triphosphate pyrophosphohydrolase [Leptolyngbya foveolarum]|uniref:Nucleoside triphosphate pyrophosphohydrolase n=1 Tax=Leptolyngbya foveolarum TaxID=47253 RepID=A0A2W4U4C5_9CYAN|nr:MAG: nucleoside triphosphate pyrophosphohydrolase [Leptolyngbya foveolarum]
MNDSPNVEPIPSPDKHAQILSELQRLIAIIDQLRHPETGCPWDLKQTPETLTPYVVEEAYEVVDAIHHGSKQDMAEELGDLLLQVVLQAQIFKEQGDFDLGDIAKGIANKMVRRHPHVFSDAVADTPEAVNANWEEIKAQEKAQKTGTSETALSPKLKNYAQSMPPLDGAMKISQKAAKAGFEWDNIEEVWAKVDEEIAELKQAIAHESKAAQAGELGDVFFSLIQVARWHQLNPAEALQGTSRRFVQRFEQVEAQAQQPLNEYSAQELNAFWNRAKQQIKQDESGR